MMAHNYDECPLCYWHNLTTGQDGDAVALSLHRYRSVAAAHCAVDRVVSAVMREMRPDIFGQIFFLKRYIWLRDREEIGWWLRDQRVERMPDYRKLVTGDMGAVLATSIAPGEGRMGFHGILVAMTPEEFDRRLSRVIVEVPDAPDPVTGHLDLERMRMVPDQRSSRWPELVLSSDGRLSARSDVTFSARLRVESCLQRSESAFRTVFCMLFEHVSELFDGYASLDRSQRPMVKQMMAALQRWKRKFESCGCWGTMDREFSRYGLRSMDDFLDELRRLVDLEVLA